MSMTHGRSELIWTIIHLIMGREMDVGLQGLCACVDVGMCCAYGGVLG